MADTPVHIAVLKIFATEEIEFQNLKETQSNVTATGHLKEGGAYGVLWMKPALRLLQHHSKLLTPEKHADYCQQSSALLSEQENEAAGLSSSK